MKQFPVHSEGISIGHDSSRGFHAEAATWNGYEFAIDRTIANSQFINRQLRTISIYHRAPRIWQRFGHCLRVHNYVVLSKQLRVYDVPYAWETNWFQWKLWTNSLQKNTPYWCFHCVYVTWGSVMLMSSAFPRNGMRRGPGGSGSLIDFALDIQADKMTRETAPTAMTMASIPDETSEGWFHCSLWLHFILFQSLADRWFWKVERLTVQPDCQCAMYMLEYIIVRGTKDHPILN